MQFPSNLGRIGPFGVLGNPIRPSLSVVSSCATRCPGRSQTAPNCSRIGTQDSERVLGRLTPLQQLSALDLAEFRAAHWMLARRVKRAGERAGGWARVEWGGGPGGRWLKPGASAEEGVQMRGNTFECEGRGPRQLEACDAIPRQGVGFVEVVKVRCTVRLLVGECGGMGSSWVG